MASRKQRVFPVTNWCFPTATLFFSVCFASRHGETRDCVREYDMHKKVKNWPRQIAILKLVRLARLDNWMDGLGLPLSAQYSWLKLHFSWKKKRQANFFLFLPFFYLIASKLEFMPSHEFLTKYRRLPSENLTLPLIQNVTAKLLT